MAVDIIDFAIRPGVIDGLKVVTLKQITDERGTIRELFRRSAFASVGVDMATFHQINVTETRRGAVRGLHAEAMTKLVTVTVGSAFGVYLDLRQASPTFGSVESVSLVPGTQVLVPAGVANGFQALDEHTQYVYCFDAEWRPDMSGYACDPFDPDLAIAWPIEVDVDDPAALSAKDRDAPSFAHLRKALS